MTRWFRFYDDAVNDPKVQRLPGEKFKAWVNLLCLASKSNGVLPALQDIAFSLRLSEDIVSSYLDEFCAIGLLDPVEVEDAPMSYEPHNWDARQYKSDTKDPTAPERNKRYRDRKRNERIATVTVTPTRTETEQIQNQKDTRVPALVFESDWPKDFREAFWQLFPKRVDKQLAFKKLEQLRRAGKIPWASLIEGVRRYAESVRGTEPNYIKGPAAWLNAGKWEDEITVKAKPTFDVRAHIV